MNVAHFPVLGSVVSPTPEHYELEVELLWQQVERSSGHYDHPLHRRLRDFQRVRDRIRWARETTGGHRGIQTDMAR